MTAQRLCGGADLAVTAEVVGRWRRRRLTRKMRRQQGDAVDEAVDGVAAVAIEGLTSRIRV